MPASRPRAAWATSLLTTAVTAGLLSTAPAHAVVGDALKGGSYTFVAKLDIGGERSCTAALVEKQWLLTAASCFADNPAQSLKVPAGAPQRKTTATIGRTDLAHGGGTTTDVVELVPRSDRDLVMARLAAPVTGITPADITSHAPLEGEELRVAGYGRTKDEWVPDRLHAAGFAVGQVQGATATLTGKTPDAAVCQGDTGGPAFRDIGGRYEVVGVNSRSWQGGCFGTDASETRKDAVTSRVDDVAAWVKSVAYRGVLGRANWKNAAYLASGHFTAAPGGKRHMDLFVVWKDASASIFEGSESTDPKAAFVTEHKIAKAGSDWKYARGVAGGSFTGSSTDGLAVYWKDGEVTEYAHLDTKGTHDEKKLREPNKTWLNARKLAVGRYTPNARRDDLIVVWADGSTAMFADVDSKKLTAHTQLSKADKAWSGAAQVSSGQFTGKKTDDLLIRWNSGETSIFPGVDAKGYHGRTRIREAGSSWRTPTCCPPAPSPPTTTASTTFSSAGTTATSACTPTSTTTAPTPPSNSSADDLKAVTSQSPPHWGGDQPSGRPAAHRHAGRPPGNHHLALPSPPHPESAQ
ncbi:S1 family peptidase [Streptomyces huiliensis]|uniref:S1 family peptidase n=1 Tax=Streptomyces huiliensis TaxID=2876027 RepID=UPI001CBA9008|nr:S1 family peptidase [Streptomyces huiliensis]MBZ4322743.1 S1 family peptidase [Streptomyces huiliensis]